MKLQRTFQGLEATLCSRGIGRFFVAAFLLVWLAFGAGGEGVVGWFLFVGAKSLFTGQPPEAGREPLTLAPAFTVGVFLIGWLALWTIGGLAALTEFVRLLWSK